MRMGTSVRMRGGEYSSIRAVAESDPWRVAFETVAV